MVLASRCASACTVTVDELVGEDAFLEVERDFPVDIARGVPLVAFGFFVKAAQIGRVNRIGTLPQRIEISRNQVESCSRTHLQNLPLPNGRFTQM